MTFLRRLWDEAGNVSEDEPTLGGFIAALAVFVMGLITVFVYLTLFAPVGA
jgi:hypothetical protein